MTFVSFPFFLFIAGVVLTYYLAPKKFRWVVLLAGSCVFYWLNSGWLLLVLLGTSSFTWLIGIWIQSLNDRTSLELKTSGDSLSKAEKKAKKEHTKLQTKRILLLGILVDLGLLLFLKYYNFFSDNLNRAFGALGGSSRLPMLHLLLPLGISFYTLQAISYMTDVYRGKIRADRSPVKFMLFMSFFPQIVQGPIPRHSQLAHQLYEGHDFDYQNFCFGIQLMLWGLFKKLVIADRIAIISSRVFDYPEEFSGSILFFAAALYGLQVYTDFSGGMDIARGFSQMVGVELELNFNQPYFSRSIEEFWRRWHITLGGWMRDYVFYPLSLSKAFTSLSRRSRKAFGNSFGKKLPPILSMFIVYLLVGIWHGSSWKYIAYGIWNGIFIMAGILFAEGYGKLRNLCGIRENSFTWRLFQMIRTFFLCTLGRFFSRADRLLISIQMLRSSAKHWWDISYFLDGTLTDLGLDTANWILLLFSILFLLFVGLLHEKNVRIREAISRQSLIFRWSICIVAVLSILVFGIYGPEYEAAAFIYEQF